MTSNYDQVEINLEGCKFYYLKHRLHRLDGPAIEYPNNYPGYPNYKGWWVNGIQLGNTIGWQYTKIINNNEEFLKLLKLRVFW